MRAERKPDGVHFPIKNAKKRHLRRHTRKGGQIPNVRLFYPRGNFRGNDLPRGNRGNCSPLLRA